MNFRKIVSLLIIFLALSFLVFNIYQNWWIVATHPWRFSVGNLSMLVAFLSVVYLVNATSWHFLMKALGVNLSYLKNLKIWLFSNTARLIPGAVWQYGSRVVLASNEGVTKQVATSALFFELFFILSTGLLIILIGSRLWNLRIDFDLRLLLVLIPIFSIIGFTISKITKVSLALRWVPILFFSYLLQFIIDGLVLFYLSKAAADLSHVLIPVFVSIFALSWLLGYISFFTPAGLGVQEVSMATLLSFYMPFPIASIVAITFRFVLYLSEGLTILFISNLSRRS